MRRPNPLEMEALEELFLDQLEFKVRAVILLLTLGKFETRDLLHHMKQLTTLSQENLEIIKKYVPKGGHAKIHA